MNAPAQPCECSSTLRRFAPPAYSIRIFLVSASWRCTTVCNRIDSQWMVVVLDKHGPLLHRLIRLLVQWLDDAAPALPEAVEKVLLLSSFNLGRAGAGNCIWK